MARDAYGVTVDDVALVVHDSGVSRLVADDTIGTWSRFRCPGMQTCVRVSMSTLQLLKRDVRS